jgi:aminoglycoside phosphotransferase (APT) family kinase protein
MNGSVDIEDRTSLEQYLTHRGLLSRGERIQHRTLGGGVSNKTVWLELPSGRQLVMKQALARLRVRVDWFSDPARIRVEAAALRTLGELLPVGAVPDFVFEDENANLLAMCAVPAPHDCFKTLLLEGTVDRRHIEQFATILATLHGESSRRIVQLAKTFGERRFFESLRLEPYYEYAAGQLPATAAFFASLVRDTRLRTDALTHGDYSPKNLLVHRDRLVLLDHEVAHVGDPAFDVGFASAHLLSKANHLVSHRDAFLAAAARFHQRYLEQLGPVSWEEGFEARSVRHTLGCLIARVVGRSPLEYLNEQERKRQVRACLEILDRLPGTLEGLRFEFGAALKRSD